MSNSFKNRYPDFASIEYQIRQAHAERSVALAAGIADGIVAAIRWVGSLFSPGPVTRNAKGAVVVKAAVTRNA